MREWGVGSGGWEGGEELARKLALSHSPPPIPHKPLLCFWRFEQLRVDRFAEVDRCVLPRGALAVVDGRYLDGKRYLDAADVTIVVEIGLHRNTADGGVDGRDAANGDTCGHVEPNPFGRVIIEPRS